MVAKARLANQGLIIPHLELISAHMAIYLLMNVRNALDNVPTPKVYGWLDSTVALHWIKGNGQYKQFVANRVTKIQLPVRDIPRKGYTRYVTNLLFSDKIWKNQEIYSSENILCCPQVICGLCAKHTGTYL